MRAQSAFKSPGGDSLPMGLETARDLRKDGIAKALLSDPGCLAHIVRDAVAEARGMSVDEIVGRLSLSGNAVRTLSEGLITGFGSVVYDLVFEFEMPDGVKAVIDVEIQGSCPPWIGRRQMMYLSGLAWYANRSPARDYSAVRPVYCIWIFLNPKAEDRNRMYAMKLGRKGSEVPMTLVEMHIGDPEGVACGALRLLDILFMKDGDARSNLERAATEFNIDWGDGIRGNVMSTLEEFIAEYRIGLIESAKEDGFIEGKKEGKREGILQERSYMRSVMIANYVETVRKAISAGMSENDAMALVPEDIADEVAEALRGECPDGGFRRICRYTWALRICGNRQSPSLNEL